MRYATWDGKGTVKIEQDIQNFSSNRTLYYSLPYRFIEHQTKSYGGYFQIPLDTGEEIPRIIVMGYNRTLIYRNNHKDEILNGMARIKLHETNFFPQTERQSIGLSY
uniref:uncharacterized protein LOC125907249 n=1 Tax=Anopheles coluzzii TaxID=1518534 RepID=UPI0020FFF111|nr:uncharacterized protein LOC125907249 [Anopheles coluzzii]